LEDPGDFPDTVVLCHLQAADEACLADSGVPNRSAVCEDGDDQGIVDFAPVEEIEATDRVAEDAYPTDVGAGVVGHNLYVHFPVEVAVDENPQESEGLSGGDALWAEKRVSVPEANDSASGAGTFLFGEGHQLHLGQIGLEAVPVEPTQDLLEAGGGSGSSGSFSGGGGIDGPVIHIE